MFVFIIFQKFIITYLMKLLFFVENHVFFTFDSGNHTYSVSKEKKPYLSGFVAQSKLNKYGF